MRNRISVTWLDQFQSYLSDDIDADTLYQRIYGKLSPNLAMQAGTAMHALLETNALAENATYDGFIFTGINDLDGQVVIGETGQREQKHLWYGVDGVELVGKIDVETACSIIDHKLTSYFDPERYFNAWQWRAYLTMRGKNKFTYQIFECYPLKDNKVNIKAYHQLDMFRYDGMEQEVKDMIAELNRWLEQHKGEKSCVA